MNKTSIWSNVFTNGLVISRIYPQEVLSRSLLLLSLAIGGLGVLDVVPCQARRNLSVPTAYVPSGGVEFKIEHYDDGYSHKINSSYKIVNGQKILIERRKLICNGKQCVAAWQNISARYRPSVKSRRANPKKGRTKKSVPEINTYVSKLIGRSKSFTCVTWFCDKKDASAIHQKAKLFSIDSDVSFCSFVKPVCW